MAQALLHAQAHVTTIQLHDDTIRRLNSLKKELKLKSYEEVIRELLKSTRVLRGHISERFQGLKNSTGMRKKMTVLVDSGAG